MAFFTSVDDLQAALNACISVLLTSIWYFTDKQALLLCNDFRGSLAFFENVLRFLKPG